MQYFESFPKLVYDIEGTGNYKLVTDILRRFKVRQGLINNTVLFDKYNVKLGETPEMVSQRFYNSPYYHWVILSVNNIKDRFYDWPLDTQQFENYVNGKYTNANGVHHYEITQTSGPTNSLDNTHVIEVNSTTSGAQAVSNYEYEQRLQDQKRQIKVLSVRYLSEFIDEFKKVIQR